MRVPSGYYVISVTVPVQEQEGCHSEREVEQGLNPDHDQVEVGNPLGAPPDCYCLGDDFGEGEHKNSQEDAKKERGEIHHDVSRRAVCARDVGC